MLRFIVLLAVGIPEVFILVCRHEIILVNVQVFFINHVC